MILSLLPAAPTPSRLTRAETESAFCFRALLKSSSGKDLLRAPFPEGFRSATALMGEYSKSPKEAATDCADRGARRGGGIYQFSFFCGSILSVYIRTCWIRYRERRPLCQTILQLWRPKDLSSWKSSSACMIFDRVPLPR